MIPVRAFRAWTPGWDRLGVAWADTAASRVQGALPMLGPIEIYSVHDMQWVASSLLRVLGSAG